MNDDGSSRRGLATPLELTRSGTELHPVVVAHGEIDVATSPRLRSVLGELLTRGATDVTIDISGVSFIDSSGLGVLVGALKQLREHGGVSMRLDGAQDSVRKVFEITGLDSAFLID